MDNLRKGLDLVNFRGEINEKLIQKGVLSGFVPLLRFTILAYSRILAKYLSTINFDLFGKNDLRFVEAVYNLCLEVFKLEPSLSLEQLLQDGMAEEKIAFIAELISECRKMHKSLLKKEVDTASSAFSAKNIEIPKVKTTPIVRHDEVLEEKQDVVAEDDIPKEMESEMDVPETSTETSTESSAELSATLEKDELFERISDLFISHIGNLEERLSSIESQLKSFGEILEKKGKDAPVDQNDKENAVFNDSPFQNRTPVRRHDINDSRQFIATISKRFNDTRTLLDQITGDSSQRLLIG